MTRDAPELLHQIIPVQYILQDCTQPKMEPHDSFVSIIITMNKLGRQEHGSRHERLVLRILLFLAALHNHLPIRKAQGLNASFYKSMYLQMAD